MRTFRLDKLVRDKVLPNMEELGQKVQYRVLGSKEQLPALKNKMLEEVSEFDPESGQAKELLDVLEAVEEAAIILGTDFDTLRQQQLARREVAGGFAGKIFVETVTLEDGDPWAEYYTAEPERFPEIKENNHG